MHLSGLGFLGAIGKLVSEDHYRQSSLKSCGDKSMGSLMSHRPRDLTQNEEWQRMKQSPLNDGPLMEYPGTEFCATELPT